MLFCVTCIDKPNSAVLRAATRAVHLEYMIAAAERLRYGGPLIDEQSGGSAGSLFVIDLPGRAELDAFLADEPYNRGGLFQSVTVRVIRQMVPEISPGFLLQELARERTAGAVSVRA